MPGSLRYCLISLVALFYGLCLVSNIAPNSKDVCEGDYVQLFQNITLTYHSTVNLWINGLRKTLIGTWILSEDPVILEGYKEKIYLDKYGTIWIRNIQLSEDGKYLLQYNTDHSKSEVKINVMVAPNNQCTPNITQIGSVLKTSLEAEDCGRPQASVHWVDHPNISIISDSVAILHSDTKSGTYFACAETPALRCVTKIQMSDYCSHFTIEGQEPSQRIEVLTGIDKEVPGQEIEVLTEMDKDITDLKTIGFVMISFILIVVVGTSIAGLTIIIRRNKKMTTFMKIWMPNECTKAYQDEKTDLLACRRNGTSGLQSSPQDATN